MPSSQSEEIYVTYMYFNFVRKLLIDNFNMALGLVFYKQLRTTFKWFAQIYALQSMMDFK